MVVPVLDDFSIFHPVGVEGKSLVELAWLRRGILTIDPVNNGHDVALGQHDLRPISIRRFGPGLALAPPPTVPPGPLRRERFF